MIVTVEMSLYPLVDNFEKPIIELIQRIRSHKAVDVYTNAMSTQIRGEWEVVMDILTQELLPVYDKLDTVSTVIKIVNRNLPIDSGHLLFAD